MGKRKQRPTNMRTIVHVVGNHSVSDEWPAQSYSGKHLLRSRVGTRVIEGEVYVEKYVPGKTPATTIHRSGNAFVQDPDVIYAIGSVYGAKTISLCKAPINPVFIPLEEDENR